jgi:hypothetical protein
LSEFDHDLFGVDLDTRDTLVDKAPVISLS